MTALPKDLAQQYLDIAEVILVALDTDGDVVMLNRKGHEVLEHPEGSLIGKNWFETCLPERERERLTSIFRQLLAGDVLSVEYVENLVVTRSGRERLIAWHNTLLRDPSGQCLGTLGSGRDITESKRVERALRESEERFRRVVETSPDAIVVADFNGRILMANQQAALLGGFADVEELLASGKNGFGFLAPEEWDRAGADIQKLFETSLVRNTEYDIIRTDGGRLSVEVNVALLKDATGSPSSMICMVRDISERKRAAEKLADALREWSVSFDAMADGVSLHGTDHTILNVNQSLCQLVGKTKEELIGRKCYEVFHGANAPVKHCPCEKTRHTLCKEYSELFEPSLHRWLAVSASPVLDARGSLARLVHVVRDVSERKQAVEELRQTQRQAVAANQAKSEFLANMSHEIRTPMTAILGFTELLMHPNVSTEEQQSYLQTIRRNGKALLALLDEILDLSKIEAGKMTVESTDCNLRHLIDDVLAVVRVRAQQKGLSLEVDYDDSLPELVRTDPVRLRQILVNLAGNAIKFTGRGGVRIAAQPTSVPTAIPGTAPARATIRFVVSDTGIGIAPETVRRLFQPFTQADASTTRRFGGTGLGLVISKRLAKLLGGDIDVTSELGHGSAFAVTVEVEVVEPRRYTAKMQDKAMAPEALSPRTKGAAVGSRVLLAEDAPDVQELLGQVLRGMGLRVEVAVDGLAACEKAARSLVDGGPYDLILMDVQMPGRDGLEAAEWLREHGWQGPIVALTAHAMAGDREKCLAAGCTDYLAKTTPLPELRSIIARYLPHGG